MTLWHLVMQKQESATPLLRCVLPFNGIKPDVLTGTSLALVHLHLNDFHLCTLSNIICIAEEICICMQNCFLSLLLNDLHLSFRLRFIILNSFPHGSGFFSLSYSLLVVPINMISNQPLSYIPWKTSLL